MPYLRVETNVPQSKIPADLPKKLCEAIASSLGKPINYCVASVTGDVAMSWGASDAPYAQATLMSIGQISTEMNKKHSKVFYDIICKELGISNDRMYIFYQNADKANVGFQGTTFHDLF